MKLVRRTYVSLATLAVVLIAILSGCSGSDPLSTTVGSLVLDFQMSDPGASQYEIATMTLGTAVVRPVGQEGQDSLGGAGVSLLANEIFELNLNSASNSPPAAALPAGSFLLEEINFFVSGFVPISLVNQDPSTDPMAACIDRLSAIPRTIPGGEVSTFDEQNINTAIRAEPDSRKLLRPNVVISIPTDGTTTFPVRINSDILIQAYVNAVTCSDDIGDCRVSQGGQVPCIDRFDGDAFFTELEGQDWISF